MPPDTKLAFMVEFELLVKPKQYLAARLEKVYPGWTGKFEKAKETRSQTPTYEGMAVNNNAAEADADALREEFRKQMAKFLTILARIPTAATNPSFLQWSVLDHTMLDELPGYCRVKLVSRAIDSDNDWQEEFDRVFASLDTLVEVECTEGCSTRIQVLPLIAPRGLEGLKAHGCLNTIAKALSYFARPVDIIMIAEGKSNPNDLPNMLLDGTAANSSDLREAYSLVKVEGWKPLFNIYDSRMENSLHSGNPSGGMGNDSHIVWNFQHVVDANGMVEFRQYPGINTSTIAKHWVSFTLGFIYAAAFQRNVDWNQIAAERTYPSVEDLDAFIKTGLGGLESESQGALKSLGQDISEATR